MKATFGLKKMPYSRVEKFFSCWNLSKPMAVWHPRPLKSACKVFSSYAVLLPRNADSKFWKFSKGGPQEKFSLSSKFKFFPKSSHLMANFLYISYLKTVLCWRAWFYHSALINEGHFWAKKNAIQQGRKIFFLLKSFETYGGLTPSTSQISM